VPHQAVFFDFGGTLFSYEGLREHFDRMLHELAVRHRVDATSEKLRRVYRETMGRTFREFARRPFYLHRELFRAAHLAFLTELGANPDPDDGDVFYAAQSALGMARVVPREGARQTLEELRQRGIHLAVVSNIDDDQFDPLWDQVGLAAFFDATTTSEEARSCKPDPAIFRVALGKAGDPPPEEVVFVGDSVQHDVAGARALGMTTVLITSVAEELDPSPHHVISDLRALLEIVET
jgi:putative hydrolase of the HAD superfamily